MDASIGPWNCIFSKTETHFENLPEEADKAVTATGQDFGMF
jgi:hypothetical protein